MSDNWVGIIALLVGAVIVIGLPIARAYARRMDRAAHRPQLDTPDVIARLDRIEQSLEAVATEVERVSEGQRFTTKLLSNPRAPAVLAAPAQPEPQGTVMMGAARRP